MCRTCSSSSMSFVSICRATAVQSPPSSCSFRALLEEEEENSLIRVGQTGAQRGQGAQASPVAAAPAARRVTFKCAESSEPERPTGWVSIHNTHWSTNTQERGCWQNKGDDFCSVLLFSTWWRYWGVFIELLLGFFKSAAIYTRYTLTISLY